MDSSVFLYNQSCAIFSIIKNVLITHKRISLSPLRTPSPSPCITLIPSSSRQLLICLYRFSYSGFLIKIIQYVVFSDWYSHLIFSVFIHVEICITTSFFSLQILGYSMDIPHCLSVSCLLVGMWVVSNFWLLWIMLPVNIGGDDFFFNDCLFAIFSVKE